MNKWQRLRAAFRREPVDQVPVAFWRHFPIEDQTAAGLAKAVATFQRRFDLDLVKVTPASDYMCVDWGMKGEYRGSLGGTRDVTDHPVKRTADWQRLRPLDVGQGCLGMQLEALRLLRQDLAGEAPMLQTIFSPLTTARKLAGDLWHDDLRDHPDALHHALDTIADTTARFAQASLQAGADGIFFATQMASKVVMSEEEHRAFGEQYDRQVLAAVAQSAEWNVLHLHGEDVIFALADSYPVAAVNWHDRRTPPTLAQGLEQCARGLIGGLDEVAVLQRGRPEQVAAQAEDAVALTVARGLILGAGCVIQIDTPEANIEAAIAKVRH